MPKKKLDQMTVDELAAHKANLKSDYRAAVIEAKTVSDAKIHQEHVDEATKQVTLAAEREGRTPEDQARYWLSQDYSDPGKHLMARRFLHQRVVNNHELAGLAEEGE